ncbi:histone deacetylase 9-B [Chanos chanos]|uniref:histone deacetylase n=1 Tax=Chanos chanos TaxID=29144 RepID=A0A6J2W005_CHACN|nr:histone deacetylase 9-B-like [Chanos chanos]
MPSLGSDPSVWEQQLQEELLLIQKQQQIQKQRLISQFQERHQNLIRQHQAQLQEHQRLQQEVQAMKQQQEQMERERRLEEQSREQELEKHHREQPVLLLKGKERSRESAVVSTEVKQKLQEFLLSKSTKDSSPSGVPHTLTHQPKLWCTTSYHVSLDRGFLPLAGMSPSHIQPMPPTPESRDDFPLRKTASEPNLKVRSRLKQKVAERRSSPLLKRREGNVMTPFKKRALELFEFTVSSSVPGSSPSSPSGACGALGTENGPSSLPTTTHREVRSLGPEGSVSILSLHTSPSLPNITLGLTAAPSPVSVPQGMQHESSEDGAQPDVPTQLLGSAGLPIPMETKVSNSHQALLQHLLQKEQLRQQNILSNGQGSLHPPSPLALSERPSYSTRPKLPRHRPLNRTRSAPLPQSTLAQLVLQQQHQNFLEKQKRFHQQVVIHKILSKSIEQLRQPSSNLPESEEEEEEEEESHCEAMQQDCSPSGGVIRNYSPTNHYGRLSPADSSPHTHPEVIKVKDEPIDMEEDDIANGSRAQTQSLYLEQVKTRQVIKAMI